MEESGFSQVQGAKPKPVPLPDQFTAANFRSKLAVAEATLGNSNRLFVNERESKHTLPKMRAGANQYYDS
eukprot:3294850-Pyramimonas_sp.AAC.1